MLDTSRDEVLQNGGLIRRNQDPTRDRVHRERQTSAASSASLVVIVTSLRYIANGRVDFWNELPEVKIGD